MAVLGFGFIVVAVLASLALAVDNDKDPGLVAKLRLAYTNLDRLKLLPKDEDWVFDFTKQDKYTFSPRGSRYEFGEPARRAFLTALTQRRSDFDAILFEANQFMNEKFRHQFVPLSIDTSFPSFPTLTGGRQEDQQDN
ncbi:hypothetical protein LTR93_011539 [Exophiala xenobiotica]|nr:hypothetical protein LTR93_011539 [Exophiala xenobiotica]